MLNDQTIDNAVYAALRDLQKKEGLVSCSPNFLRGVLGEYLDMTTEITDALYRLKERGLVEHADRDLWCAKEIK